MCMCVCVGVFRNSSSGIHSGGAGVPGIYHTVVAVGVEDSLSILAMAA